MKFKVKAGDELDIAKASVVQFRRAPLFNQTLAKHKEVAGKIEEFIKFKTGDPLGRFGKKDQHFIGGILKDTGLIHTHLTGDISLLYKRSGKNPMIIDLIAVLTHDELGTGQPANMKQQKKMAKILSDQDVK